MIMIQLLNLTFKQIFLALIHSNGQKMATEYSDIHRGFLQAVMSRGSISENSSNKVLVELFAASKYLNSITKKFFIVYMTELL